MLPPIISDRTVIPSGPRSVTGFTAPNLPLEPMVGGTSDSPSVEPAPAEPLTTEQETRGYAGWSFGCSSTQGAPLWVWAIIVLGLLSLGTRRPQPQLVKASRRVRRGMQLVWVAALMVPVGSAKAEPAPAAPSDQASLPVVSVKSYELASAPSVADQHGRLHLLGLTFAEVFSRQGGFEAGASLALNANWDLGATLVLGNSLGYRAVADWHPSRASGSRILPFVQVRAIAHPVPEGIGLGLGAWGGASFEAGPGRVRAGALAEGYYGPKEYYPYAIFAMVGYEVDLLKPVRVVEYRDRVTEIVKERRVVEERVVEAPAQVTVVQVEEKPATTLRVRVTDLEDKPLEALVRLISRADGAVLHELAAAPEAETPLDPGQYQAEVSAKGYLQMGSPIILQQGEKRVEHYRLRPAPSMPVAKLTADRIELNQRIEFAFNKSTLLPSAFPILDEVVDILLRNPKLFIRVEGHTCSKGKAEYNQTLSQARALSVVTYLESRGIDGSRLTPMGFGMTQPIASNSKESGRIKNRRVEFKIIPPLSTAAR